MGQVLVSGRLQGQAGASQGDSNRRPHASTQTHSRVRPHLPPPPLQLPVHRGGGVGAGAGRGAGASGPGAPAEVRSRHRRALGRLRRGRGRRRPRQRAVGGRAEACAFCQPLASPFIGLLPSLFHFIAILSIFLHFLGPPSADPPSFPLRPIKPCHGLHAAAALCCTQAPTVRPDTAQMPACEPCPTPHAQPSICKCSVGLLVTVPPLYCPAQQRPCWPGFVCQPVPCACRAVYTPVEGSLYGA